MDTTTWAPTVGAVTATATRLGLRITTVSASETGIRVHLQDGHGQRVGPGQVAAILAALGCTTPATVRDYPAHGTARAFTTWATIAPTGANLVIYGRSR